jgi:hypothetical protein
MIFPLLFCPCLSSCFKKSFLCRSMMYFVKFGGALRGKFMELEDRRFESCSLSQRSPLSFAALPSISLFPSARFADVADKGRRITAHETRERHERKRKPALKFSYLLACLMGRIVLVLFACSRKHREFPLLGACPPELPHPTSLGANLVEPYHLCYPCDPRLSFTLARVKRQFFRSTDRRAAGPNTASASIGHS